MLGEICMLIESLLKAFLPNVFFFGQAAVQPTRKQCVVMDIDSHCATQHSFKALKWRGRKRCLKRTRMHGALDLSNKNEQEPVQAIS